MKQLFPLLIFCCSLSFGQASLQSIAPVIAPEVQKTFDHLVDRATSHGIDYHAKLEAKGFQGIFVVDSLPADKLAKYHRTGSTFIILVAPRSVKDLVSLEFTLAHDLGHGLGLEHETEALPDGTYKWSAEIMSGSGTLDKRHIVYQIMVHPDHSPGIWERYFHQL